jgi:hypothetical protein
MQYKNKRNQMKSLMQIAEECDLRYNDLLGVTQREKIEPYEVGRKTIL